MAITHPLFDHENFHFEGPKQIIISYAIRDNNRKVSPKEVRNCRLVNSDWLRITTQVLQEAREPLFYLKLDHDHDFKGNGYFGKKEKKLLELDQATSFALTATKKTYLGPEKSIKTIAQHLSQFRDNLVSLNVAINPGTSSLLFLGDLKLSLLQQLSVEFTKDTSKPASLSLQTVLDSCPELKSLGFSSEPLGFRNVVLPEDFTRVTLPETLTAIDFSTKLENEHLEIMTRSSLPKLKKFTLLMHQTPFKNGLVYRVLDNVKSSLEHLIFIGADYEGSSIEVPTYFRFPVMAKLTTLYLKTPHLELEPGVQSLETYLPEMSEMTLMLQTQGMLRKWTRSQSRFATLTKLYVTMTDDIFSEDDYIVNLDKTATREIAHTFPNVLDFMLDFRRRDFISCKTVLKAVWQEMKQLQMLTLIVSKPKGFACQDQWTSILLGVSLKIAANLRTKRRKTVKLNNSSVKEMKNLKTLRIVETFNLVKTKEKNSNIIPLLSYSVFELAFLKMPQLKIIMVQEKFWVSQKMTQKWESSSGRKIYVLNDTVETE